ncbi:PqqD family peptide modification chaperone [Ensifer sp. MJa1]|uniref:PqqD family peptide modification chaperone n=1 Tax=Ensifer sp. MJa1 TaxID=2919888 RepID=UPI00300A5F5C
MPSGCAQLRFVTQARLSRIRGQNILFSGSQHAIFSLNDTAAAIWRMLEEGKPADAVVRGIACGAPDAGGQVEAALKDWQRLGLIRPRISPLDIAARQHVTQTLSIAGRRIRILYPMAHAFPTVGVFRHLEVEQETTDVVFQWAEHDDRLHLFRNGDWLLASASDEMATVLKGEVLNDVLGTSTYELALHVAALLKDERLVLLCGDPGAGKTTLTLALAHAGFGVASDDVTLLQGDGRCVGLPFAAAVKSGAWPLLAPYFPDLAEMPVFRRPDNRRVRYIAPKISPDLLSRQWPVGSVVMLRRDRDSRLRLDEVGPVDALCGLLGGAFAPGGELGAIGFDALARVVGSARAFRLTYSDLDGAVDLIRRSCR